MRILHVTPYYPPDYWGGIEVHVYELCKYSRNHITTVATSRSSVTMSGTAEGPVGTRIYRLRSFELPRLDHLLPRLRNPYVPFLESKLAKIGDFDLLHVHGQEFFLSHSAVNFANKQDVPCVLSIHNTGQAYAGFRAVRLARSIMQRSVFKKTIENSNFQIAVSRGSLKYLNRFGATATALIPNGIDLERFANLEKANEYVLFVGRLEPLKAPEIFVRAVPLILQQVRTRFLVVGSGSLDAHLRRLAHELGASQWINFRENLTYDELAKTVARASVLVAPANAGYSILEAGAAGKPVVSVRSDWNEEALGRAALYVEPNDIVEIAKAVVKILKNDSLSENLGQQAHSFIGQNRDWRVIYPKIDAIYKRLVS
jgi:glycosyltransferase involved in cell wall biosynthesis